MKTQSLLTGAIALTRTPEAAHSMARLFVRLSTAALAAPVWLAWKGCTGLNKQKTSVWDKWLDAFPTSFQESLSTYQRWCSQSHLHAVSSMRNRLWVFNNIESVSQNIPLVFIVCIIPAWQHWKVPVRFVSITAFQPLEEMCSAGLLNCPPPLFTKKSILPYCFNTDDTRSFTLQTWGNQSMRQLCEQVKPFGGRLWKSAPRSHFGCYTEAE